MFLGSKISVAMNYMVGTCYLVRHRYLDVHLVQSATIKVSGYVLRLPGGTTIEIAYVDGMASTCVSTSQMNTGSFPGLRGRSFNARTSGVIVACELSGLVNVFFVQL